MKLLSSQVNAIINKADEVRNKEIKNLEKNRDILAEKYAKTKINIFKKSFLAIPTDLRQTLNREISSYGEISDKRTLSKIEQRFKNKYIQTHPVKLPRIDKFSLKNSIDLLSIEVKDLNELCKKLKIKI